MRPINLLFLIFAVPQIHAWGVVGHEVIATIAAIHLHPSTELAIDKLLKGYSLASIAAWADRIRGIPDLRWTGQLHYTSPIDDLPPSTCHFDRGFSTENDVLNAISNFTEKLIDNPMDGLAIRLLVHFVGDVHQPLHLTNRNKGGNGDPVKWENRRMSMHGLWDGGLITTLVREQKNYTRPLPNKSIESKLRGTIYDPLIRLILWEGIQTWWKDDIPNWFHCNPALDYSPASPSSLSQLFFSAKSSHSNEVSNVVCPVTWATGTHKITCDLVYPPDYDQHSKELKELRNEKYYGPIRDNLVIEKLLAQGGLRLAATLNKIFASEEDLATGLTKPF